jgi:predicted benzoate:H+ symporter BenE
MRLGDFEFSLRELAGSLGDFGTLFPLAIGYIAICGMNPAGLLIMMGLTNVATGLVYHLPMPLQPKKAIAATAIAQEWPPSLIYASGFGTGLIWLVLRTTGLIRKLARVTPKGVTRGIQLALGIMLAIQGFKLISTWWLLGILSVIIVLILRENRYAPAAIVLMVLGVVLVGVRGQLLEIVDIGITLPPFTVFTPQEVWRSLVLVGFAQIFLTFTNAIIATASLIGHYWPQKTVTEEKLALNTGFMNVVASFLGGMPMCHGAGGLAGQYYFGARTGGTNIIEGLIEINLGLWFSQSIANLFVAFPSAIIGAMMFLVGVELAKFVRDLRRSELLTMGVTTAVSLATNMAIGFAAGAAAYYLCRRFWKT